MPMAEAAHTLPRPALEERGVFRNALCHSGYLKDVQKLPLFLELSYS